MTESSTPRTNENPLYSFMPTGSHELRVMVFPGSVEMHCDGHVIRQPISKWMAASNALSDAISRAEKAEAAAAREHDAALRWSRKSHDDKQRIAALTAELKEAAAVIASRSPLPKGPK